MASFYEYTDNVVLPYGRPAEDGVLHRCGGGDSVGRLECKKEVVSSCTKSRGRLQPDYVQNKSQEVCTEYIM